MFFRLLNRKEVVKMINNKIYLKNLEHFNTISKLMYAHRKLLEMFSSYGEVRRLEISIDKNFGIVEMSTSSEVKTAKKNLNGVDFNGKKLMMANNLESKKIGSKFHTLGQPIQNK
jgi:RNA recognition motif-containing protein